MAVPDFQTIMRPLLVLLADGREQPVALLRGTLAEQFALTPEELAEELPSGRAKTFVNRVGWATTANRSRIRWTTSSLLCCTRVIGSSRPTLVRQRSAR